jgi:signal transduction histidine kinase
VAIIDMLEDITEYRQAQDQLAEAQKLEAIGRLVGAVAHDFNNLLTGIMLYCDLMSAETEPDSRVYRHASEVHLAAEHGAALVRQLLTITRKHVVDLIPICLNDTVTSMQNLLNRLIGEQIQLVFDLDPSLPQVLMDPTHAQQVVLNLVLNSRDAMPGGGRVVIGTRTCEQPTRTEGQTRQLVSLAVTDDGCGMDAETKTRLFEPFFTTKEAGKGNGLGLATVYRIVHDGGGSISVDSELGQGCRIELVLPAVIKFGRTQSESHTLAHIQNAKG